MTLPPGDYESVVQVLASRAAKLAGFSEGGGKELSRAVADLAAQAGAQADVTVRFTFGKESFLVALQPHGASNDGDQLLASWEKKRAHRLMDEARIVGEPGSRELLLVKTSS